MPGKAQRLSSIVLTDCAMREPAVATVALDDPVMPGLMVECGENRKLVFEEWQQGHRTTAVEEQLKYVFGRELSGRKSERAERISFQFIGLATSCCSTPADVVPQGTWVLRLIFAQDTMCAPILNERGNMVGPGTVCEGGGRRDEGSQASCNSRHTGIVDRSVQSTAR
jgi:hypothetical protein